MADAWTPTVATPVTLDAYVEAVLRAWKTNLGLWPSEESVGVLWAHYALETGGGAHCYGYNLGNVKHVAGDGHDYCELKGVWEGCSSAQLAAMQAGPNGHLVRLDPSLDHQRAVGKGRVAAIFDPPHPTCRFRAYPSLEAAMTEHLELLRLKRYASAWPAVELGNVSLFAERLHERGYYTASVTSYAKGMTTWFDRYLKSGAYAQALERVAETDTNTHLQALPDTLPLPPLADGEPILHSFVPFPSYRGDPDEDVMVRDVIVVHEENCASWDREPCSCPVQDPQDPPPGGEHV